MLTNLLIFCGGTLFGTLATLVALSLCMAAKTVDVLPEDCLWCQRQEMVESDGK